MSLLCQFRNFLHILGSGLQAVHNLETSHELICNDLQLFKKLESPKMFVTALFPTANSHEAFIQELCLF